MVHPGNPGYVRGDTIKRQHNDGGSGSQASDQGEGEDDFTFTLSKDEFMQLFFEDLELPHLLRTHIGDQPQWKTRRAGFSTDGTPHNLAVVRTMRQALGRRIALSKSAKRHLLELQEQLQALQDSGQGESNAAAELKLQIEQLQQ